MNKTTYSTYRCTSNDFGKYALLGSIKYKVEDALNIYPIYINFKASVSGGRYYDEAIYSLRIWLDGSSVLYNLVEVTGSKLFNCCLDVTEDVINLYTTTNTVAGATVTIEELESSNSGFIEWKNFEKFEVTDDNFTKKVTSTNFDKLINSAIEFTKAINVSNSITLNKGTLVAPIQYQRQLSDGKVIEGDIFVTSNGKLFIGLRGEESEILGNEKHSAIRFADKQLEFIGDFIPDITDIRTVGNKDYKIKNIYSNAITLTPVLTLPTEGLYNGYTVFNATIKMQCTYYNGKWYNSKGEEVV